jgi:hypothetical protein
MHLIRALSHVLATNTYSPTTSFAPNYDYSGPDSMCGFNGSMPLFPVKTMQVAAGSTIGFAASYMADSRKEEEDFSEV